ncbi:hypothetical protein AAFO90_24390, partial [Phaeobacter sp. CAU 1743]|uniref:hypothetical protein n=1 Tax=Phaeobacter sp. CAU 1743 TaxID=3140367 RepID=UPI00325B36B1
ACDVVVFFMVLLSFRFDHPEPTAQGKQRHPSGKLQHQPGHPQGVETLAQFEYVRDLGVDFAQGFFHARPLSPREAEEFLSQSQTSSMLQSG